MSRTELPLHLLMPILQHVTIVVLMGKKRGKKNKRKELFNTSTVIPLLRLAAALCFPALAFPVLDAACLLAAKHKTLVKY